MPIDLASIVENCETSLNFFDPRSGFDWRIVNHSLDCKLEETPCWIRSESFARNMGCIAKEDAGIENFLGCDSGTRVQYDVVCEYLFVRFSRK